MKLNINNTSKLFVYIWDYPKVNWLGKTHYFQIYSVLEILNLKNYVLSKTNLFENHPMSLKVESYFPKNMGNKGITPLVYLKNILI